MRDQLMEFLTGWIIATLRFLIIVVGCWTAIQLSQLTDLLVGRAWSLTPQEQRSVEEIYAASRAARMNQTAPPAREVSR